VEEEGDGRMGRGSWRELVMREKVESTDILSRILCIALT
jgi:hypothetical protein